MKCVPEVRSSSNFPLICSTKSVTNWKPMEEEFCGFTSAGQTDPVIPDLQPAQPCRALERYFDSSGAVLGKCMLKTIG